MKKRRGWPHFPGILEFFTSRAGIGAGRVRRSACAFGLAGALVLAGCGGEPDETAEEFEPAGDEQVEGLGDAPEVPDTTPEPPPAQDIQPTEPDQDAAAPEPQPEPQSMAGSGETVWAEGAQGEFIGGLDGGLYEPYHPATVEEVQRALRNEGIYSGPINGVLDQPTMEALGRYQENNGLQVSGVPSPRTREMLLGEADL